MKKMNWENIFILAKLTWSSPKNNIKFNNKEWHARN